MRLLHSRGFAKRGETVELTTSLGAEKSKAYSRLSFWEAIRSVLEDAGEPLHSRVITKRILEKGLWRSEGKTPAATVAARLYKDIKE